MSGLMITGGMVNKGGGGVTPPSKVITPKTITENGVFDSSADGVDGYNPVTVDVASSGSGGDGWQPHPDWWDIEQIFKDDPDPNKRCIVLFADGAMGHTLNFGNSEGTYKTSDGKTLNHGQPWNVDDTQDKVGELYNTRYAIFYSTNQNLNISAKWADKTTSIVYVYCGNYSVPTFSMGSASVQYPPSFLEAVKFDDTVVLGNSFYGTNAFKNTHLRYINRLPETGNHNFENTSLRSFIMPQNGVNSNTFSGCREINQIIFKHPLKNYTTPEKFNMYIANTTLYVPNVITDENPIEFPVIESNPLWMDRYIMDLNFITSYRTALDIVQRLENAPPPYYWEDLNDPENPTAFEFYPSVETNFPELLPLLQSKGYNLM